MLCTNTHTMPIMVRTMLQLDAATNLMLQCGLAGPSDLHALNPSLVYTRVSGYGQWTQNAPLATA